MLLIKRIILIFFVTGVFVYYSRADKPVASSSDLWVLTIDSGAVVPPPIDTLSVDSAAFPLPTDSIAGDSIAVDTLSQRRTPLLEAKVDYQSNDSIIMTGDHKIFLYGEGNVKYQTMELDAEYIEVNMDSSFVYASFALDSIGDEFGYPVFKDGDSEYESKTMRYNFKTKKGFATDGITQQGEGYVTATRMKKMSDNIMYMAGGRYTTCDDHDHPHFYVFLTKAKVRTGKNIVTGPAYLVIADVPLPLAIPFGFFPFTSSYSSGILMPTYGDEMARGFYLRDGGYYFAFSDYVDLALTGEIYTKGSWGLNARSSYRKKYKYSGNVNLGYLKTITGDKGIDYSKSTDFRINWTHSQDPKANPYQVLSASVNFASSSYDRNQINSIYNPNAYTSNTKASSISYTRRFPDSPWTISANMQASQSSRDSTVSVTLPNLTITMSTVFPFRKKKAMGNERWYEKISLTYNGTLQNSINTKEDLLFKSNIIRDWKNNMVHNIPVSATFNALKYINITPSISYRERWYTNRITKEYDTQLRRVVPKDTIWGFNRVYDYSASLGVNTKLYGFFKPWKVFGDKVEMIRHVFTPTVSFSARPDFGAEQYGFWRQITYMDTRGNVRSEWYTPFQEAPGRGKSGALNFSVQNNLEMKVKSNADSTGVKKISLIDNLTLGGSYNLVADSMKWSDFSLSLRLKLSKSFTLNLNGVLDPYTYNEQGNKQDVMRWEDGKGIARLKSTGTSFSYTFNNETIKKVTSLFTGKKSAEEASSEASSEADPTKTEEPSTAESAPKSGGLRKGKKDTGEYDDDGYLKTKIPWSLAFNYGLQLNYDMASDKFNAVKREYPYKITQNLGFSGTLTPTPGWSFNFSTSYDFDSKKLVYMNCNISRNLHCWSMSASVIPIGPYKSYNFHISVNSSLLHDLKYDKSSNYRDAMTWY
ncbi:MAG: LPS-assembly protein LptD [Dysgonamonadaceae bacterium]|jgi:hypothetical protein|nr:LPS-assembly protein LptD [Dysgonamonadaceae bacterium]